MINIKEKIKNIISDIKTHRRLYRRKDLLNRILESGNINFLKFSTPGHFYSPIPDAHEVDLNSDKIFDRSESDLPAIHIDKQQQNKLLIDFAKLYPEIPFKKDKSDDHRYYLDNPFFSYGDGIILYSFMRHFQPKRIIEIGSGHSSAEMLDINDAFLNKETEFTFIEPFPERLYSLLTGEDRGKAKIIVSAVQDVDMSIYLDLKENDILFIDSSHVAKINSDVLHIIFNVLPKLNEGVIVHFHDILWPFEYPKIWLDKGRAWNEAYMLRAFLQYNPAFEILYFNSYMETHEHDAINTLMPDILKKPSSKVTPGNTSLWLRKKSSLPTQN